MNVTDAASNVVKTFREAAWKGNIVRRGGTFKGQWLPTEIYDLLRRQEGGYIPQLKSPSRLSGFKDKTIGASKSKFKKTCDKEIQKGNTPIGFIVGVKANQKQRREQVKKFKEGDVFKRIGYVPEWMVTHGVGHAVAVNCKGNVVADTAPSFTPRKQIDTNRILFFPRLMPGEDPASAAGAWPGFVKDVFNYFLGPDSPNLGKYVTRWGEARDIRQQRALGGRTW